MNKLCKKIGLMGVLVLICTVIIGVPKDGEHPPFLSEKSQIDYYYSRV